MTMASTIEIVFTVLCFIVDTLLSVTVIVVQVVGRGNRKSITAKSSTSARVPRWSFCTYKCACAGAVCVS